MDTPYIQGFIASVNQYASGSGDVKRKKEADKFELAIAEANRKTALLALNIDLGKKLALEVKHAEAQEKTDVSVKSVKERASHTISSLDKALKNAPEGRVLLAALYGLTEAND